MRPNPQDSIDDKLDSLLRASPVSARGDFTARTLARLHQQDHRVDALVERKLAELPVRASADFTHRTVARARGRSLVQIFNMPVAAAAAMALTFGAFWVQTSPTASPDAQPAMAHASAGQAIADTETAELRELVALAEGLSDAEPLLDARATDALAAVATWSR